MSRDLLRKSPLFAGLNDEDLERLYDGARRIRLAPGAVLMTEGEDAKAAYVVIEGVFEVTRHSGDREYVIDQRVAGDFMGEIGLLENALRTATVRAVTDVEVLEITRATFQDLLRKCPGAALAVLQTVASRLRHSEATLRQSEKMAALGTLSAGLAHELNNPAAAVQRSASQLREALAELERCTRALAHEGFSDAQMALVGTLQAELSARMSAADGPDGIGPDRIGTDRIGTDRIGTDRIGTDALARDDAESELQEWLEALGIGDAWEIASSIVAAGWGAEDLSALMSGFAPGQQAALARWLAAAAVAYGLLESLSQGADRITEIVAAVRSYAYLDRAPVQLLDIHDGLENTLVILRHKLKHGVEVIREYDRNLPRIEAYGSELNQVWTNLLDNAIDAMHGHGMLRIRTFSAQDTRGSGSVVVEIVDTGPGIPAAIQDRIFDAFFTTKEPGQGSGLGLHIAYNIVVNQHRGKIALQSYPGETTFTIALPVQM